MIIGDVSSPAVIAQVKKLEAYPKIAKVEFTDAMRQAIVLGRVDISARAPIGTGKLATSTTGEIRYAAGDEVRGVMKNEARAADGFPYGYALDASPKYKRRRGRGRTRKWFKGFIGRKRKDILQLFDAALRRTVEQLVVKS